MGFSEQAQLSELHRLAQNKLQTIVANDVASVFPMLEGGSLDASFGNYYAEMRRVINARRTLSSSLSSTLYGGIRKDAGISSVFTPILDTAVNEKQLFSSLLVTGPISMKTALKSGASIEQARASALSSTIRASQRHVADGGRETILNATRRDREAKGWARLTDSKPCAFCAMLASRGPAYKSEQSSRFRSHDGCGCTAVPVFDLNAPWPGRAEEFRAAYDENIAGQFSGGDGNNDAIKAWRKFYDTKLEPTPYNEAKNLAHDLVSKAKAAEPEFTSLMSDTASRHGGELRGLEYKVKEEDSLLRKMLADLKDSKGSMTIDDIGAKMFDVNRYTIEFKPENYAGSAQDVIDELVKNGNTVKVKNYWNVADNPYQGINLQITSPSGQQFELQFHTPASLEGKIKLHTIYDVRRKTYDTVKIAKLDAQSFSISKKIPIPDSVQFVDLGGKMPVKVSSTPQTFKNLSFDEIGKIAVDNPEMTEFHDDNWLTAIRDKLGYNAKPGLVTAQEMDNLEKDGWTRVHRGIKAHGNKSAEVLIDRFKTGEHFGGLGMYGNGTYASAQLDIAEHYAAGLKQNIMEIAISPDAKIININDLRALQRKFLEDLAKERGVNLENLQRMIRTGDDVYDIYMDSGRFAALQGYDVISALHSVDTGMYYNILNRSKVVVIK